MDEARRKHVSKFLSKHLRHQPEQLGLTLGVGGWVPVDELLQACAAHQFPMTRAELDEVVARNDKQRFSFDPTGDLIRANQGHSVEVDLQLEAVTPPEVLYHGTGEQFIEPILREGLRKMSRQHAHLSRDTETARKVGSRHGKPAILQVAAGTMYHDGYIFYCSANGVWLTDHVPAQYLTLLADGDA